MSWTKIFAAGALPLAAACATMAPADEVGAAGAYRCDADGLGNLIGQVPTQELGAEALRRSGSRTLRWIRPGDAVTMDFRPDRLNINLDAQHRVEGFTCG